MYTSTPERKAVLAKITRNGLLNGITRRMPREVEKKIPHFCSWFYKPLLEVTFYRVLKTSTAILLITDKFIGNFCYLNNGNNACH